MLHQIKNKRMVKIMIIINISIVFLIGVSWYLLIPLYPYETWVAPGHLVPIDGYIDSSPLDHKNNPHQTNFFMTYVREVDVKNRWSRIITHLHGYEKRSTVGSYSTSSKSSDFTKKDLDILGKKLVPFMKHDIIKAAMVYKGVDWEESISRPIVIHHPEKFHTGVDLRIGDEIVEVNGEAIESSDDVYFILKHFSVGQKVNVKVVRDDKLVEVPIIIQELDSSGQATLGVYLKHRFTFKDLIEDEVIQLEESYSGESGGFILTLGLIQQLEPNKDLTKGRKVAGTGGITRGGDIKPIGNLDLKVLTAMKEKADIFFYPKFQEEQILKVQSKYQVNDLKLVGVRNINEAIDYLTNM